MLEFELTAKIEPPIDSTIIKKTVLIFNRLAGIKGRKFFSLVFTDVRTIKRWNLAYRGKNQATDVLSFAQLDATEILPEDKNDLGEILICVPVAKKQAREYGFTLDYEICRLLIHGLAHLVGYEHEGVAKKIADKMRDFEERAIEMVFKK